MLRRILRARAPLTLVAWASLAWLFQGCNGSDVMIAESYDAGAPPVFAAPDAATPETTLTEYCPSTTCTVPYTTCPSSQYPCDINLMTDAKNCGSCGFDCKGSGTATFDCITGRCTIRCLIDGTADCNGVVDDDCETRLGTNDNCNSCGDRCDDPTNPCVRDYKNGGYKCGCAPGLIACNGNCIDPLSDRQNCGGCGTVCDGAGKPAPPPHALWTCAEGKCGDALTCEKGGFNGDWADCDGDLYRKPESSSNGCETRSDTMENCGACGTACTTEQSCVKRPVMGGFGSPECLCGPGTTLCGYDCVNLLTDPDHCGSCENKCVNRQDTHVADATNSAPTCRYGSCAVECRLGFDDCNGDPKDGCEVNLLSDQRNCGACGNACDALAGQPCIGGQCVVRPCDEEGTEAR